ncbi:MAG: ABC transporter permease [Solirubrobacteraceae bacterium]
MPSPDSSTLATPLPNPGRVLIDQVRYHTRTLVAGGRATVIGIGLPVVLLITSSGHGHVPATAVAQHAAFGLTIIAFMTYGVRLVAAREAGILKRWRATPVPRSCYFLGRIIATTLVAVLAGAITVAAAVLLYHTHLTATGAVGLLITFALGGAAWAAVATILTRAISSVEGAAPIMMILYFPTIIISGVLGNIDEPHWLHTLASYLPAGPVIDAATSALQRPSGAPLLPAHDVLVLTAWAVIGIAVASLTFRWDPHRPRQRRTARAAT